MEKEPHLGGKALELRKFYNRPLEVQKWMDEKISGVKNDPRITLFTQAELKHLDGHLGRFQARIQGPDRTETDLSVSAIIVATGYATQMREKGDLQSQTSRWFSRDGETPVWKTRVPLFSGMGRKWRW